ncbi:MAG: ABC transporter ATP-binding protein [Rhodobacteraceae bacterium]|nr:ABC transporter ATP-binding protein [Paracoccaceae bacterium]MCY4140197.1 ABC transporter ATP-binding protein [Paracoccaceae bacterium]
MQAPPVINLLKDLRDETGVALLFVSHELAVVENICDRLAAMYLGRIIELASRNQIFDRPAHPCNDALLAAVPRPSPVDPPSGCAFHPRFILARKWCRHERPGWNARTDN